MTTHYIDITLLPDPEFSPSHLRSALFSKLHRALAHRAAGDIGVSFPGLSLQGRHLGDTLRLHGTEPALLELHTQPWLQGMRDHVLAGNAIPVPADVRHRVVRRVQAQSNPARLRRRQMRRHGYDEAEALRRIPDSAAQHLHLPYLHLQSSSTGQSFRLFVEHGPLQAEPRMGYFSAYGLSTTATVPWF
ncbi:type I-F CRISPR-associated endoribonuclease Cas6/Csy4 [Paracidovorax cattleyae]|uniref:CRISPR-associated protein, Csy4 family n=1 Tax=Paracidovorax cattleyae TaxID=80868 RepID=A0A1H0WH43_9BURK|nr:type I-F CRISPR-associated endoribonuclease Cas6/Csy4 [Paracidovorax cattleyae]MBF9263189.1 type I-F CRISPR-associated endoribonuclease Cas6/Csy4 [Paracidovorax cattleyae]SDP90099.1 CRISPR-associated protein, Csy4 family [Paracidovorax cattleyae]